MNNTRPPLTADLDRCAYHAERPSVAWRDARTEYGTIATIAVCAECAALLPAATRPVANAAQEKP